VCRSKWSADFAAATPHADMIWQVFKRFVEVGRVAVITGGAEDGKLGVIIDVIDQTRALVSNPSAGVARQAINFRRLRLTKFKVCPSCTTLQRVVC
jgi:hypothetical protein